MRSELIGRGKYKVKPVAAGNDAVLTGEITSITSSPVASTSRARRRASLSCGEVEFKDLKSDKVLWSNPSVQFREQYEPTTAGAVADVNAFLGQDVNASTPRDRVRALVVSAMLEAF